MTIITKFETATDFWNGMVEPDYNDFVAQPGSLRLALHLANSLFHMSDWVYHSHKAAVSSAFTYAEQWADAAGD